MIGIEARYWFLFALALIWMIFASVQDIKKREVANWLNFSLIAFALAYRAFYSAYSSEWMFFVYGVAGFLLFVALGNLFYYARVFAGGDAKLLMALGAVLPFESGWDLVLVGGGFVMLFFIVGAVYSLVYSIGLTVVNWKRFSGEFGKSFAKKKRVLAVPLVLTFLLIILSLFVEVSLGIGLFAAFFFFFVSFLYIYLGALDVCMIKLTSPSKLTEGDWIINDIKLKGYVVKKTVHGLSLQDIARLRRAGKKVMIKSGIPFVPSILISFLIMVFFLGVLGYGPENLFFLF